MIVIAAAFTAEAKTEFSRYEVILTRKPFGEPPAEPAPGTAGVPVAASFIKDIKLVAITDSEQLGIRVGFIDLASKKNYYLKVGESEDGIEVVDADYEKGAACLRKGAEQYWIDMKGQNSPGNVPAGGVASAGAPAGAMATAVAVPATRGGSYSERQRQRREALIQMRKAQEERAGKKAEEQPKEAKTEALKPEEVDTHLKEYQMKLIRAGGDLGPPLPMQLTKDMDDQLVAEGVLPAQDEGGEAVATEETGVVAPPVPPAQ